MKTYPIQLAMPQSKIQIFSKPKATLFSDLSPLGNAKKYKFHVEQEYYEHYSKSYFAVTTKKAGWDCLRHYEIAAAGTLPYFLNIESCPKNTLFAWPKDMLTEIKKLPGVPSESTVRLATKFGKLHLLKVNKKFNTDKYWNLHSRFMEYFKKNLTSDSLSAYFLESLGGIKNKKILLVFGIHGSLIDYMRDIMISSLATNNHISLTVYPNPYWQLKSCHYKIRNTFYGRGFTYSGILDANMYSSPENWNDIKKNIDSYDAIVACSSSNTGFESLPQEVQETLSTRKDIVWIDGNDARADHKIPKCAKVVYKREMM